MKRWRLSPKGEVASPCSDGHQLVEAEAEPEVGLQIPEINVSMTKSPYIHWDKKDIHDDGEGAASPGFHSS